MGEALLCVGAVTLDKGHDLLLDALATLTDVPWSCTCVGSLERDPPFASALRRSSMEAGLSDRVHFTGPLTEADLDRTFAGSDVLVLPSRTEAFGMVVVEALARGLPVIATDVGGVSEALGHDPSGARPGLLVAPDDPGALADAIRAWLTGAELRGRLRRAARGRRESLTGWSTTTSRVADVLAGTSA
jgi:glycosyltransferase involved in cell wall biosynthesis